jgi:hypothetical protein
MSGFLYSVTMLAIPNRLQDRAVLQLIDPAWESSICRFPAVRNLAQGPSGHVDLLVDVLLDRGEVAMPCSDALDAIRPGGRLGEVVGGFVLFAIDTG